jgi:hypothetical protein
MNPMQSLIPVSLSGLLLVGLVLTGFPNQPVNSMNPAIHQSDILTQPEVLAKATRRPNNFYRGSGRRAILA